MYRWGVVLLGFALPVLAQVNFGTIGGRIEDASHAAMSGVHVSVRAIATGALRGTVTNQAGLFEFASLAPARYSVEASAVGFSPVASEVTVEVGQNMTLDFTLTVSEKKDVVAVSAAAETLKTQDVSLGEVVESRSVQELSLNGRMLVDLALTVPDAHIGHGAQTGETSALYWRPGQRSAITIGGNRPNANYFLLDGATNTDPTFNTMNLSPSPDAVQEFQVQTGSYSAEMGGAGGGQINIVTRQGTRDFHGTAYEFLRDDALDARTWNEMPGSTHLVQNNFGASLGGPLPGGKTFFFANMEFFRATEAQTMFGTVPTPEETAGNFSDSGTAIYNPKSAHPNPAFDPARPVGPANPQVVRDPFPGNVISPSLLNPAAARMLASYVPGPNSMSDSGMGMTMMGTPTVFGTNQDSNNFQDVRNARHRNGQGTLRLDRVFNQAGSLSARYSVSKEDGFMPQNLPGFGFTHDNAAQNGSLIYTRVMTAHLVNTASVSVSRLAMSHFSENSGVRDIVGDLGIRGVGFGGQAGWGAPSFNVQGFSPFGDSWLATPMQAWDTIVEGRELLSWQKGQHALKFGASYRWFIWPMWALVQSRGYYSFTSGFTTRTATSDGTGSALASFLLGLPAVRQLQVGTPSMNLRQWYADSFVQDTWRATPNTTVDIGIRYEYMSALVDISRNWANLLQQDGKLAAFIGGQTGMPRGLMFPNKLRFAPRLGLARHMDRAGLVLRAAYGIFYTPVDMNTWCNQLHNVPVVYPITQQSDNFTPGINGFDFAVPVLGKTVTSFAAFDPYPPAQYIQQWSASVQKRLGRDTTLEAGYHGERGLHLQRSHLINNAVPAPGALQPRRPHQFATFLPGTVFPDTAAVASSAVPVSTVNLLENTARSWYDAGYLSLRRRYAHGLSLLANYTFAKNLSDAPDFRSPMSEAAIPQNNGDLAAEKGPACDIRHRLALSAVYDLPQLRGAGRWARTLLGSWRLSLLYQVQSGFPFTVSVFGDTANAGTVLGENPVRANYTGRPVFGPGTRNTMEWFSPAAFAAPAAFTFGNAGRNTVYGPGFQTMDLALVRSFALRESVRMELRAEGFNALNHANWGTPNRFVNTAQFGTITEASTPGRELQLGARVSF